MTWMMMTSRHHLWVHGYNVVMMKRMRMSVGVRRYSNLRKATWRQRSSAKEIRSMTMMVMMAVLMLMQMVQV
jgi:hypothetical protein